ncbi:MAG: hypothetical protein ACOC14_05215 [Bacillota bacterium]
MFVKGELSRSRALKRRKRNIKGKTIKQKFSALMPEVIDELKTLRPFMETMPASTLKKYDDLIEEKTHNKQLTNSEDALDSLIECYDDIKTLKDDLKHGEQKHTHEERLLNILTFLRDFHSTLYTPFKPAYDDEASEIGKQINAVAKTFKLKTAKLEDAMRKKEDEMLFYERENKSLADALQDLSSQSVDYTTKASKIKANHKTISALKSHLSTLRKNRAIMENLARMFEQLAINEAYHNNLKAEGPIKKLIRKIDRNPDSLDIMNDTAELTETLQAMKEELSELHSMVEPAQRMAFDEEEAVDEDLISQYQSMNKS